MVPEIKQLIGLSRVEGDFVGQISRISMVEVQKVLFRGLVGQGIEWIDTQPALTHEPGVARLASYLAQPGIGLELVVNSFREVFLGE